MHQCFLENGRENKCTLWRTHVKIIVKVMRIRMWRDIRMNTHESYLTNLMHSTVQYKQVAVKQL